MPRIALRGALASCCLALFLALSLASVAAQTATPGVPTAGNTAFSGKVTHKGPTLNVSSNGQDRAVNPGPNVTVVRDGKPATVNDLKDGDQVNVTTNPDGTASRIETTSTAGGTSNVLKWLIPLLVLLALLLLVVLLLSRRRGGFVLERNRPVA